MEVLSNFGTKPGEDVKEDVSEDFLVSVLATDGKKLLVGGAGIEKDGSFDSDGDGFGGAKPDPEAVEVFEEASRCFKMVVRCVS